jgi:hypothetical protein
MDRRTFVLRGTGLLLAGVPARWLSAQTGTPVSSRTPITVYKSSTCGCCAKWVDHLRANGFTTTVHDTEEMDQLKDELGVPPALRSCHTALAEKYLIEGHVPAADIRRLLAERPKAIGLAVPGMPSGTPGMAQPGDKIQDFAVLAFQSDGSTKLFARY